MSETYGECLERMSREYYLAINDPDRVYGKSFRDSCHTGWLAEEVKAANLPSLARTQTSSD